MLRTAGWADEEMDKGGAAIFRSEALGSLHALSSGGFNRVQLSAGLSLFHFPLSLFHFQGASSAPGQWPYSLYSITPSI